MKRIKTIYKVSFNDGKTSDEKYTKTKRTAIKNAKRMAEKYGDTVWVDKFVIYIDNNTFKHMGYPIKRSISEGATCIFPSTQARVARKLRGD